MTIAFDFDAPAPEPICPPLPLAHAGQPAGAIQLCPEIIQTAPALAKLQAAWCRLGVPHPVACAAHLCRSSSLNHHLYAFTAQARHHGHTDPALTVLGTDPGGRNLFDEREVARFANELLCGVRSDRPTMTPERWAAAIAKARGEKIGTEDDAEVSR